MIRRFEAIKSEAEVLKQLSNDGSDLSYEEFKLKIRDISDKILEELT